MRHDGARAAQQRDIAIVDVAAVRREEPWAEKAVPGQVGDGAHAVMAPHELHFGSALREVNRGVEVVRLRKRQHRLQELWRRGLGKSRRRKHADAALVLAVPRREELGDAL